VLRHTGTGRLAPRGLAAGLALSGLGLGTTSPIDKRDEVANTGTGHSALDSSAMSGEEPKPGAPEEAAAAPPALAPATGLATAAKGPKVYKRVELTTPEQLAQEDLMARRHFRFPILLHDS